jgi:hypothetical protein
MAKPWTRKQRRTYEEDLIAGGDLDAWIQKNPGKDIRDDDIGRGIVARNLFTYQTFLKAHPDVKDLNGHAESLARLLRKREPLKALNP